MSLLTDSKAIHRPPPQPPPPSPLSSSEKQIIVLIDCESVDAKHVLSEVAWIVISPSDDKKNLNILETKHLLCKAGSGNVRTEDKTQAQYIYKHVTGLSFTTLLKHGQPYYQCLQEIKELRSRYPSAKWLARDPKMEKTLLHQDDIHEVLDYLVEPINTQFYHKVNRDRDIESDCFRNYCCGFHEGLVRSSSSSFHEGLVHHHHHSPPRHPHCAQVDVYVMLEWLKKYGRSDLLGLDCFSSSFSSSQPFPQPLSVYPSSFYLAWNQFVSSPSSYYVPFYVSPFDPKQDHSIEK